jgi:hypothetical protein
MYANMPWEAVKVLKQCLEIPGTPMPEFSLYAQKLHEGAVEETLRECQAMDDEYKAKYEAQRAGPR